MKGKHIVAENLRQLCIFKTTAGADREKATSMWWDYIDMFSQKCNGIHPSFTAECSEAQMKAVGYAKVLHILGTVPIHNILYRPTPNRINKHDILTFTQNKPFPQTQRYCLTCAAAE